MENNLMLDWINDYIRGEIDYLKREEDICGFDKERYADMVYLENLTEEDINKILDKVLDDNEVNSVINETIHYYLYH